MTNRKIFHDIMNFKPVNRIPAYEFAPYWDETINRWKSEGLPKYLKSPVDISSYFGLDPIIFACATPVKNKKSGLGNISNMADYERWKTNLYPDAPENYLEFIAGKWKRAKRKLLAEWARMQQEGSLVFIFALNGYFWFPRTLFGIEKHLFAFYDNPDVMHRINNDLSEYNIRAIERVLPIIKPDMVMLMEDMSYNNGPMISKALFDEFMAPYYREINSVLKAHGIKLYVDSDGDITECTSWFLNVGVSALGPLERQAGVDLVKLQDKHPDLRLIGGYDKTVMSKGKEAMIAEFERILPAMQRGGYIPSVDHQTPPEVSLDNYKIYVDLLKQYCSK